MTSPQDLQADLDDLESDAGKWSTAADEIDLAHGAAQNLILGIEQFGWVADEYGVVAAYEEVQAKLVGLLAGAHQEFDKVAAELRETAATYGRTDTTNVDRFHSLDEQGQGTIQEHSQGRGRINE